eukprot:scaffold41187_cov303-Isochrysis_galbana.AAC.6
MYRVYIYIAACTNRSAAGAMIHLPVLRVHRSRLYHSLPCSADGTTVGSVRGRAQFALVLSRCAGCAMSHVCARALSSSFLGDDGAYCIAASYCVARVCCVLRAACRLCFAVLSHRHRLSPRRRIYLNYT